MGMNLRQWSREKSINFFLEIPVLSTRSSHTENYDWQSNIAEAVLNKGMKISIIVRNRICPPLIHCFQYLILLLPFIGYFLLKDKILQEKTLHTDSPTPNCYYDEFSIGKKLEKDYLTIINNIALSFLECTDYDNNFISDKLTIDNPNTTYNFSNKLGFLMIHIKLNYVNLGYYKLDEDDIFLDDCCEDIVDCSKRIEINTLEGIERLRERNNLYTVHMLAHNAQGEYVKFSDEISYLMYGLLNEGEKYINQNSYENQPINKNETLFKFLKQLEKPCQKSFFENQVSLSIYVLCRKKAPNYYKKQCRMKHKDSTQIYVDEKKYKDNVKDIASDEKTEEIELGNSDDTKKLGNEEDEKKLGSCEDERKQGNIEDEKKLGYREDEEKLGYIEDEKKLDYGEIENDGINHNADDKGEDERWNECEHKDEHGKNSDEDENGEIVDKNEMEETVGKDENGEIVVKDKKGEIVDKDEKGETVDKDEKGEIVGKDEKEEIVGKDEKGEIVGKDEKEEIVSKDEKGEIMGKDKNGEIVDKNEIGEIFGKDKNGKIMGEWNECEHKDENGKNSDEDENGEIVDKNEMGEIACKYENKEILGKDENKEFVGTDEKGVIVGKDEKGEIVDKDKNGDIVGKNENGTIVSKDAIEKIVGKYENGETVDKDEIGQFMGKNENGEIVRKNEIEEIVGKIENGKIVEQQGGEIVGRDENEKIVNQDTNRENVCKYKKIEVKYAKEPAEYKKPMIEEEENFVKSQRQKKVETNEEICAAQNSRCAQSLTNQSKKDQFHPLRKSQDSDSSDTAIINLDNVEHQNIRHNEDNKQMLKLLLVNLNKNRKNYPEQEMETQCRTRDKRALKRKELGNSERTSSSENLLYSPSTQQTIEYNDFSSGNFNHFQIQSQSEIKSEEKDLKIVQVVENLDEKEKLAIPSPEVFDNLLLELVQLFIDYCNYIDLPFLLGAVFSVE